METKNNVQRRMANESIILNAIYLLCMFAYILIQLVYTHIVSDYIFILLLSFGTIFVNVRQKILFEKLYEDKLALDYYRVHGIGNYECEIADIFCNRFIDFIAVIWGAIFGYTVSFILSDINNLNIKVFFAIYLASANIPTALAAFRLYKLYEFYKELIDKMNYDYYDINNSDVTFVITIRNFILFTVVTYVTSCLTGVLFTKINLGVAYQLYTIFAIVLIIAIFAITNYYIYKNKNEEIDRINNRLDHKISAEYKKICETTDYYSVDKIEAYKKCKSLLYENKMNFSKVVDVIKLVGVTALPLLIEWFLNKQ